jgi:hypothetical protein
VVEGAVVAEGAAAVAVLVVLISGTFVFDAVLTGAAGLGVAISVAFFVV